MAEGKASVRNGKFAQSVIPLLQEYTQKLRQIAEQSQRIREEAEKDVRAHFRKAVQFEVLEDLLNRLRVPMKKLAQSVSQKLEHGDVDDIEKLELKLRLAEFEHALSATERLVAANREE